MTYFLALVYAFFLRFYLKFDIYCLLLISFSNFFIFSYLTVEFLEEVDVGERIIKLSYDRFFFKGLIISILIKGVVREGFYYIFKAKLGVLLLLYYSEFF